MVSRDPIQIASDGSLDLQDVTEWEPRTTLDRLAVAIHRGIRSVAHSVIVAVAVVILASQVVLGGLGAVVDPVVGTLTVLSAVPAFVLAAYVWRADVTSSEPVGLLVGTFSLGVLFAGFAGVVNSFLGPAFLRLGVVVGAPSLGLAAMFYLVVGPIEEGVKLLAVRLGAFRDDRFDAVVDGAVYGAIAGLGFATIENAIYITGQTMGESGLALVATGGSVATVRAMAGPGHVIYSAFAGYYLGLAKFNPENAGPIVVKGLVIAATIHGSYNVLVSSLPFLSADVLGVEPLLAVLTFIVVFDGLFIYLLVRKLRAYRLAYEATRDGGVPDPERTEFDP